MARIPLLAAVPMLVALAATLGSCSSDREATCVRSGDAEVCLRPEDDQLWVLDVSGFKPGTVLSWTSDAGEGTAQINGDGEIDGKQGLLDAGGGRTDVEFSGTVVDGSALTGMLSVE